MIVKEITGFETTIADDAIAGVRPAQSPNECYLLLWSSHTLHVKGSPSEYQKYVKQVAAQQVEIRPKNIKRNGRV